jgi:hypothetical protein
LHDFHTGYSFLHKGIHIGIAHELPQKPPAFYVETRVITTKIGIATTIQVNFQFM